VFLQAAGFLVSLLALLGLLLAVYVPATQFGISFDDSWNLNGLPGVSDLGTALEFVFGGNSGPLGRPLSLASFLPTLHSWPSDPQDFILQNILLHLVNTTLVVWLAFRITPYLPWPVAGRVGFALVAGAWWASSPLLHSTSTMIIQRMTSLSATFCLAACIAYIAGREALCRDRKCGFLILSATVVLGTTLAALSKESGALLPGYLLTLERLLIARSGRFEPVGPISRDWLAKWQFLFLWTPIVALVTYLLVHLPVFSEGYSGRRFTMAERLLSEARILFTYLRQFLFPVRDELGPYHDDFVVSTGLFEPLTTLPAVAGVLLAPVLGWLARNTQWRLLSFAVAWFLCGHILESTVVPLELYFEHRNYLPTIGIALSLSAVAFHPSIAAWLRCSLLASVLSLNLFILRESSLVWSEPYVAASVWYERRPESLRALQFYLVQLSKHGTVDEYISAVDAVLPPLSDGGEYVTMRVAAYCGLRDANDVARAAENAVVPLRARPFVNVVPTMLDKLADAVIKKECPGLDEANLQKLLEAVLSNPNPVSGDVKAQLHEISARLAIHLRDFDRAIRHLEQALLLRPVLSDVIAVSGILVSAGRYDDAISRLASFEKNAPKRPFVGVRWRKTISEMREVIERARLADSRG
jgi:hypothetical protein